MWGSIVFDWLVIVVCMSCCWNFVSCVDFIDYLLGLFVWFFVINILCNDLEDLWLRRGFVYLSLCSWMLMVCVGGMYGGFG